MAYSEVKNSYFILKKPKKNKTQNTENCWKACEKCCHNYLRFIFLSHNEATKIVPKNSVKYKEGRKVNDSFKER